MTEHAFTEELRRVVDQQIGPRRPGAIYQNMDGAFEVLSLVTEPAKARDMLWHRSAQFALVVRDVLRADGQPFVIGSVWTDSDRLVRPAPAVVGLAA
ncbi:hypothetical protein [Streptomyces sp. NPDC127066]|uniref:hypothetical protein n=1 Tax=Streptomyces sp. NPDC127066 TaxID=3347125 RepID=UPI003669A565